MIFLKYIKNRKKKRTPCRPPLHRAHIGAVRGGGVEGPPSEEKAEKPPFILDKDLNLKICKRSLTRL